MGYAEMEKVWKEVITLQVHKRRLELELHIINTILSKDTGEIDVDICKEDMEYLRKLGYTVEEEFGGTVVKFNGKS